MINLNIYHNTYPNQHVTVKGSVVEFSKRLNNFKMIFFNIQSAFDIYIIIIVYL